MSVFQEIKFDLQDKLFVQLKTEFTNEIKNEFECSDYDQTVDYVLKCVFGNKIPKEKMISDTKDMFGENTEKIYNFLWNLTNKIYNKKDIQKDNKKQEDKRERSRNNSKEDINEKDYHNNRGMQRGRYRGRRFMGFPGIRGYTTFILFIALEADSEEILEGENLRKLIIREHNRY